MPKEYQIENFVLQTTLEILESQIDENHMTVEACVLSPCISGNKRYYPPQIVEKVAGQLKGLKSYADHDDRSIKNIVARITNAKLENGKAVATFKFSKAKDVAESIFTRIKEGIVTDVSIAASGSTKKVKMNEDWVDEITDIKLHSVDFVSEGGVPEAKILQVFESNNLPTITEGDIEKVEKMTLEELRQTQPELVTEIEKPIGELKVSNETLIKEVADLKAKIQERELTEAKNIMLAELKEDESIKKLISVRMVGTSIEELKKSLEENLALIKQIKEATAKVNGNPEIIIEGDNKKKYTSSKEILEDITLSQDQKATLINKLWFA